MIIIATNSISHNVVIEDEQEAEQLASALEEAERLSKKKVVIDHLNERITELQELMPKEVFDFNDFYFAGGCIYSLYNSKEPKDYDVFCKKRKAISKLLAYCKANTDKVNIITDNAISMGKYQFIIKHVGKPEVQVKKFDFKHNMFYYDNRGLETVSDWKYISSNKLEFNRDRARDVLNIISRIPKFVGRGMEISQSEIFDILEMGTRPSRIFGERRSVKKSRRGRKSY